jgi:hypothetical protein
LPHIVSIGGPTIGAGMLGVGFEPFVIPDAQKPPTNVTLPVPPDRFARRMGLLNRMELAGFASDGAGGGDRVKEHASLYKQTAGMVLSPRMKAFDLEAEDSPTRDAYGRTAFGQGCLLARRLVEAGVTFVEVRSNGWDTHQDNFERVGTLAGQVDPGFASLVSDLKRKGMLDRTLVVWMGEFGRTPKINPNGGRDHFPRAFNIALAGGGVKGGQVIGASSADGTEVKDRPINVNDLMTSFCHALKIGEHEPPWQADQDRRRRQGRQRAVRVNSQRGLWVLWQGMQEVEILPNAAWAPARSSFFAASSSAFALS